MSVSKKYVDEMKEIFKKEHGRELDDDEAQKAADDLVGLVDILWEMSIIDAKRKKRLKAEPQGFPVDGQYTCIVCYRSIGPENGWYDHNNQKCLSCQKAVEAEIIPVFVCHHRRSFFLGWELASNFNIKTQTARKLVREGKLVARIVHNDEYNSDEYIFLKKENPGLVERYNPVRKSYERHRAKVSDQHIREDRKKWRAEWEKEQKSFRDRIQKMR